MSTETQLGYGNSNAEPTLRDIATIIFRRQRLLSVSFLFILAAGVGYATFFPSYKAEMKILVRRGRIDPVLTPTQTPSPAFEREEISEEEMNSEAELFRDDDILRKVVGKSAIADRISLLSWLRRQSHAVRVEKAVQRLRRDLQIQPARKSRLITVSYSSSDPRLSATVLSKLADAYLQKHAELRRPSGQQEFFEAQISQAATALQQAQEQLIHFTHSNDVVSAEVQRDLLLKKMSDAEAAEATLRASIAETAERNRTLEAKLREIPEKHVAQVRSTDNPQLEEKLKSKLLELELKRTELLTKFEPSYRLVQEVEQQITQAKEALQGQELKPLRDETTEANPEYAWAHSEQLKSQVELRALRERELVMRDQVAAYRTQAADLEANGISQHELEQKLKVAEDKYLLYVNKREEARMGDALDANGLLNVTIAEPPHAPELRATPLLSAIGFSFLLASGLSTSLVFAAHRLDPSIRTPEEVMQIIGAPVLATLPRQAAMKRSLAG